MMRAVVRRIALEAAVLLLLPSLAWAGERLDHSLWDQVMKSYAAEGFVDYARLLENRTLVDRYLETMAQMPLDSLQQLSREERLAMWINLYNAAVVRLILDHYPAAHFDELDTADDMKLVAVGGELLTLTQLRDDIIRKGFRDERVLAALVSGRRDSPKLFGEAFQGGRLEEQLNEAARAFVEDEFRNRIEPTTKTVELSPIFKEFAQDFMFNFGSPDDGSRFSIHERAVISFILYHLKDPEKRLFLNSGGYKISYLPPDLKINDSSGGGSQGEQVSRDAAQ